jgi:ABC-type uncharacterized transport system substrate-binding protein
VSRRNFIFCVAAICAAPLLARAQRSARARRIGLLLPYAKGNKEWESKVRAFKEELQRLGWSDAATISFDERWTSDDMELVRKNAASLVASNPDVIVPVGGRVIPVVMKLTRSIPIVIPGSSDPVMSGYVKSMARPEGNVTGFASFEASVIGKMLELLKDIAPGTRRATIVYNPDNPNAVFYRRLFSEAAEKIGIQPSAAPIHGIADVEKAVAPLSRKPNTALFFPPDVTIQGHRREVIDSVSQARLPAMYSDAAFVQNGGLASYSADRTELFRRAAGYVDRILRGERPGDLPFQQPTKYTLAINLKTARAMGLALSSTVIAQAEQVVE